MTYQVKESDLNALYQGVDKLAQSTKKMTSDFESRLNELETKIARGQFQGGSCSLHGQDPAYSAEFVNYLRTGNAGSLIGRPTASMSTQDGPSGGYVAPTEQQNQINQLLREAVAMRSLANVGVYDRDIELLTSAGGCGGAWVGETESRIETDAPNLKKTLLVFKELYAYPSTTQRLLDMATNDVLAFLGLEIANKFADLEEAAFISGDGVSSPRGLLGYPTVANSSYVWGSIGYVTSGHASLLNNADSLITLQHALKAPYRANSSFLMNDTTWQVIRKFKNGDGDYIWRPGVEPGAPNTLLGKPVVISPEMPDIGAGEYPIAYGDFKRAYLIGDHKRGVRILADPYSQKGYVSLYCTRLVFGGCVNFEAVKLLKIAV